MLYELTTTRDGSAPEPARLQEGVHARMHMHIIVWPSMQRASHTLLRDLMNAYPHTLHVHDVGCACDTSCVSGSFHGGLHHMGPHATHAVMSQTN